MGRRVGTVGRSGNERIPASVMSTLTTTRPRYEALRAMINADMGQPHRAVAVGGAVDDNVVPFPTERARKPKPEAPDTGWQVSISENWNWTTNLFAIRAWKNGRVVHRTGLTAEQVERFDPEAEWKKGLNR